MRSSTAITLATLVMVTSVWSSFAQSHFKGCSQQTGSNLTILVTTDAVITLDGTELGIGDEIAAFTEAGLCAGSVSWDGSNAALTVWGDDPLTNATEGFSVSDKLNYRLWDASSGAVIGSGFGMISVGYDGENPFWDGGTYLPDALMKFARFEASTLSRPVAAISIRQSNGRRPQHKLVFDAGSSVDSDGQIVSYHWDFGNGKQGSTVSAANVYEDGRYVVTLTISDNDGFVDSIQRTITVPWTGDTSVSTESEQVLGWSMNVYPNPSAGTLFADFVAERHTEAVITMYDVAGRSVRPPTYLTLTPGRQTVPLDASGLPPGVYVCHVLSQIRSSSQIVTLVH